MVGNVENKGSGRDLNNQQNVIFDFNIANYFSISTFRRSFEIPTKLTSFPLSLFNLRDGVLKWLGRWRFISSKLTSMVDLSE